MLWKKDIVSFYWINISFRTNIYNDAGSFHYSLGYKIALYHDRYRL